MCSLYIVCFTIYRSIVLGLGKLRFNDLMSCDPPTGLSGGTLTRQGCLFLDGNESKAWGHVHLKVKSLKALPSSSTLNKSAYN